MMSRKVTLGLFATAYFLFHCCRCCWDDGTREGNKNKSSMSMDLWNGMRAFLSAATKYERLWMRQNTHFLFKFPSTIFRNAVDWEWCWMRRNGKIIYLKKLHSSRDNNAQIGNFPIYDKIWIRDVGMKNMRKKFLSIILLIFIPRISNTFYSLACFLLHSFRAGKFMNL